MLAHQLYKNRWWAGFDLWAEFCWPQLQTLDLRIWTNVLFCKSFTNSFSSHRLGPLISLNQAGRFLPSQHQCALSQTLFPSKEQFLNMERLIRRISKMRRKKAMFSACLSVWTYAKSSEYIVFKLKINLGLCSRIDFFISSMQNFILATILTHYFYRAL